MIDILLQIDSFMSDFNNQFRAVDLPLGESKQGSSHQYNCCFHLFFFCFDVLFLALDLPDEVGFGNF